MIWRFVEASKATAKAKYLYQKGKGNPETNVLMPDAFQYLESMDPTSQKKYLQALCKWVVELGWKEFKLYYHPAKLPPPEEGGFYTLRFSSVDEREFALCWETHHEPSKEPYNPQRLIVRFLNTGLRKGFSILQEAEKRKIPLKDINSFPDMKSFVRYTDDLDKKHKLSKETIIEGWVEKVNSVLSGHKNEFEVVFRNKKAAVVKIPDFGTGYSLVELLTGGEAHWCVLRDGDYWKDYSEDEYAFYVIINLVPDFMADRLYIADASLNSDHHVQVWNWEDRTLDKDDSLRELRRFGIPKTVFKHFYSDPGDFEGYRSRDEYEEEGEEDSINVRYSYLSEEDMAYEYPFGLWIQVDKVNEDVVRNKIVQPVLTLLNRQMTDSFPTEEDSVQVGTFLDFLTVDSFIESFEDDLTGDGYHLETEDEIPPVPRDERDEEDLHYRPVVHVAEPTVDVSEAIEDAWTLFLRGVFRNTRTPVPVLINFSLAWLRKMGVRTSGKEDEILAGTYHKELENLFRSLLGIKIKVIPWKVPEEVQFITDYMVGPSGFHYLKSDVDLKWVDSLLAEYLLDFAYEKYPALRLRKVSKIVGGPPDLEGVLAQIMDYLINDAK